MNPLARFRRDLVAIVDAGIAGADAGLLVSRALDAEARLPAGQAVTLVAAGKAAAPMASAFARANPSRISAGMVVSTHASVPVPAELEWYRAGHPVPDAASERAGRRALDLAASAHGTFVLLLSGGASALLAVPAPGITLRDKQEVTSRLLAAGADIGSLNTVRKHLSAIKGGRLAARARGPVLAFAVSDVVGDDLSAIGSGPTVPDPTTFLDALRVLDRFGGRDAYPRTAVRLLEAGEAGQLAETPKPGDPRLSSAASAVIGSRVDALRAAGEAARAAGYEPTVIDEPVVGEARERSPVHVAAMLGLARQSAGAVAVISGGETTVRVRGKGLGGRNQEFALASVRLLASSDRQAALASFGTDGVDGPTDAAGAIVDSRTLERASALGLSIEAALENNDSYRFFAELGDLIRTGPTHTNVGDLQVLLVDGGE